MRIGKFPIIAIKGATAYEAQVGRAWVRFLRPGFWRSSWPRLITFHWDRSDPL